MAIAHSPPARFTISASDPMKPLGTDGSKGEYHMQSLTLIIACCSSGLSSPMIPPFLPSHPVHMNANIIGRDVRPGLLPSGHLPLPSLRPEQIVTL